MRSGIEGGYLDNWRSVKERNVPEKYVKPIQDMFRGYQTKMRGAAGESGSLNVDVRLHQ